MAGIIHIIWSLSIAIAAATAGKVNFIEKLNLIHQFPGSIGYSNCDAEMKLKQYEVAHFLEKSRAAIEIANAQKLAGFSKNKNYHLSPVGAFSVLVSNDFDVSPNPQMPDFRVSHPTNSWGEIFRKFESLKRMSTPEDLWQLNSSVASVLVDDTNRVVNRQNYSVDSTDQLDLNRFIQNILSCAAANCREISLTPALKDWALSKKRYADALNIPAPYKFLGHSRLISMAHDDASRFLARPMPYVEKLNDQTLRVSIRNVIPDSSKALFEKYTAEAWSQYGLNIQIRWVSGDGKSGWDVQVLGVGGRPHVLGRYGGTLTVLNVPSAVNASVLVHEFGHILGLADEYYTQFNEQTCAYKNDTDPNNIMADAYHGHIKVDHYRQLSEVYGLKLGDRGANLSLSQKSVHLKRSALFIVVFMAAGALTPTTSLARAREKDAGSISSLGLLETLDAIHKGDSVNYSICDQQYKEKQYELVHFILAHQDEISQTVREKVENSRSQDGVVVEEMGPYTVSEENPDRPMIIGDSMSANWRRGKDSSWEETYNVYLEAKKETGPDFQRYLPYINQKVRSLILDDEMRVNYLEDFKLNYTDLPNLRAFSRILFACGYGSCPELAKVPYLLDWARKIYDPSLFSESAGEDNLLVALVRRDVRLRIFSARPKSYVRGVGKNTIIVRIKDSLPAEAKSIFQKYTAQRWSQYGLTVQIEWVNSGEAWELKSLDIGSRAYVEVDRKSSKYVLNLPPTTRGTSLTHEFGHILGLPDQYYTVFNLNQCAYEDHYDSGSIMSETDGSLRLENFMELARQYNLKLNLPPLQKSASN